MTSLILKLLLGHLIGDFLLQPTQWVQDKETRKHKSKYLYFHILIHVLATLLLLEFDFTYWKGILIIAFTHFVIDLVKTKIQSPSNQRWLFFADQWAHIMVIAGVVHYYEPYHINVSFFLTDKILLLITSLLMTTLVSSVLMKVIITKWELEEDTNGSSLERAGKYIGILERLFVFGFITLNQWQAIGFLIAAKSVFRFGDLSKAKDRKLTEYILIGTLLSFGFAIICGLAYNHFLAMIGD